MVLVAVSGLNGNESEVGAGEAVRGFNWNGSGVIVISSDVEITVKKMAAAPVKVYFLITVETRKMKSYFLK